MALSGGVTAPRVLFVYFTYTQQSLKVAEAMAEVLRQQGCEVRLARIELTDSRLRRAVHAVSAASRRLGHRRDDAGATAGATAEIRIPDEATGDYDLIIIGSPTWWLKTSVPIRSFLTSDTAARLLGGKRFAAFVVCRRYWGFNLSAVRKLGTVRGGEYVDGIHFSFAGG